MISPDQLELLLTMGAGAFVGCVGMYFMYRICMKGLSDMTDALKELTSELKEIAVSR